MREREASAAPPGMRRARGFRRWWLDRSLRVKGPIVVAVPLIVLMGITSANLALQQDQGHERNVSINARTLAVAAGQVLADAVNADTGVRGYAATRDRRFLPDLHGDQVLSELKAEPGGPQTQPAIRAVPA